MNHELEELEIPSAVLKARAKAEIARIWLADGDQVSVISPRLWEDPGVWGLMLVDLAKHVAQAYASQGLSPDFALLKMREALEAEWRHPTEAL